jgi:hypothetical protein
MASPPATVMLTDLARTSSLLARSSRALSPWRPVFCHHEIDAKATDWRLAIDRNQPPVQSARPRRRREGGPMFDLRDLFQWERFITPSIIKVFYWLAVLLSLLFGLSGIFSGLLAMAVNPLGGLLTIIGSLLGVLIGVLVARIVAEFVLITFRMNEHLGAIRNRGQM